MKQRKTNVKSRETIGEYFQRASFTEFKKFIMKIRHRCLKIACKAMNGKKKTRVKCEVRRVTARQRGTRRRRKWRNGISLH